MDLGLSHSPNQHELMFNQQRKASIEASPEMPIRPSRHRKGRTWRYPSRSSLEEELNEGKLMEEKERKSSPKKSSSRRGSSNRSGTNSPNTCKSVGDISSPSKIILKENGLVSIERNSPQSPKLSEVALRDIPDSRSPSKTSNRMSAGARLFKVSEEEIVSYDKERGHLTSGRPASISISPC